jgi:3-hydroxyacyl-[acyl-carrier-protein] dehydratase
MKWYSTLGLERSDTGKMVLNARVPPDSPWFDGHFPGDPTLPGIAQLEMAVDTVRLAEGRNISVEKFRKVRFKRVIRPDEILKIVVTPKKIEDGSYAFRILVEDELACNGVLFAKDPDTANSKEETP